MLASLPLNYRENSPISFATMRAELINIDYSIPLSLYVASRFIHLSSVHATERN